MTEKKLDGKNLTMLTDFYEMTMANGYLANGYRDTIAYFDMFFRRVPNNGGFAIMAGVQQLVDYLNALTFTEEISGICAPSGSSMRNSSLISPILNSAATSGPFRRARRFSRASRS